MLRTPRVLLSVLLLSSLACSDDGGSDDDVGTETSGSTDTTTGTTDTGESTGTGTGESTDTDTGTGESTGTDTGESTDTDTGGTTDTGETDTGGGAFTLTSPAFAEGGAIPILHSCYGDNISPQLDWLDAPAGTLSFAVFFNDLSINFAHSSIWDIPAELDGLPEDVDKDPMPADVPGAVQSESYAGISGYAGPCPNSPHTYEFTLYALDVASLAGEIDENATLAEARAAFEAHALDQATLSGEFTRP